MTKEINEKINETKKTLEILRYSREQMDLSLEEKRELRVAIDIMLDKLDELKRKLR